MRALNIRFGKVIIGEECAVVSRRQVMPPFPVPQVKGEGMGGEGALPDIACPYLRQGADGTGHHRQIGDLVAETGTIPP